MSGSGLPVTGSVELESFFLSAAAVWNLVSESEVLDNAVRTRTVFGAVESTEYGDESDSEENFVDDIVTSPFVWSSGSLVRTVSTDATATSDTLEDGVDNPDLVVATVGEASVSDEVGRLLKFDSSFLDSKFWTDPAFHVGSDGDVSCDSVSANAARFLTFPDFFNLDFWLSKWVDELKCDSLLMDSSATDALPLAWSAKTRVSVTGKRPLANRVPDIGERAGCGTFHEDCGCWDGITVDDVWWLDSDCLRELFASATTVDCWATVWRSKLWAASAQYSSSTCPSAVLLFLPLFIRELGSLRSTGIPDSLA
jgi:hypothetical protein